MDLQLAAKTPSVSGSTAGIGFAIASLLAQEKAAVVVNGRSTERVEGGRSTNSVGGERRPGDGGGC